MAPIGTQRTIRHGIAFAVAVLVSLAAEPAGAQEPQPIPKRIWDISLGAHVSELPVIDFVDPSCGTNGGPQGLKLEAFGAFAECPIDTATGLHEVWFIYDDEIEYIAKAQSGGRDLAMIRRAQATQIFHQPVILSFLIDDEGFVNGYRIFTDSRADPEIRIEAHMLVYSLRARFGVDGWACESTPPDGRRTPIQGEYAFEVCRLALPDRRVEVESRHYFKPGQAILNPFNGAGMVNEFESSARLELLKVD